MSDYVSSNDLKEFLCVVPHERKFVLPETAHVLRKSIVEMDQFIAYKAIMAFETISRFADNLFQKPLRREFRVLQMYSGFFQSEVLANLLDAEKLFEAMGYRRMSDETLVLGGRISRYQVMDVSHDTLAASVECQIIIHIYTGLLALGLSCSWEEVLQYREQNAGGPKEAIKCLAYAIHKRRWCEDKLKGNNRRVSNSALTNSGGNCTMNADNMICDYQQQQTPQQTSLTPMRSTFNKRAPLHNPTLFAQNSFNSVERLMRRVPCQANINAMYVPPKELKASVVARFSDSQRKKAAFLMCTASSFGDFVMMCWSFSKYAQTTSTVGDKKSANGKASTKARDPSQRR